MNKHRLIYANELYKLIEENSYTLVDRINSKDKGMFLVGIKEAIDKSPTAYDIDEVVERLEEELERPIADCDLKINGKRANEREVVACKTGLKYAIEIVKGNCCKNRNSSECVVEVNKTSEGGAE